MLADLTLSDQTTDEPALDQRQLYADGLAHVQRLASRVWTDYNIHDPGITMLELLSYALTDLSYRASFPIADILATESDNAANMRAQFFSARQILPNRPLTVLDYRKLLIDLPGVKNAWIVPHALTYYADTIEGKLLPVDSGEPGVQAVSLGGLYDVLIDFMEDVLPSAQQNVIDAAEDVLHANRNLCEDFVDIATVTSQSFVLCTELELAPDADVSLVKATMLYEVQRYLAPAVANYSLSEMLERYTASEIFDGPVLKCGFIDDAELVAAELRTEIRLSDVMNIIMDIDGVRAVRDILINVEGASEVPENKWLLNVAPHQKALLNADKSRMVFYKRNMPVVAVQTKVDSLLAEFAAQDKAKLETEVDYDFPIPNGRFRDPGAYDSFQNHFPAVYGLSEAGLSGAADDKRRAQAFQLKAYLLFFDQVMANYMAQLAHVKDLFSTDPDLTRTYFYQVVDSFSDYSKIYGVADPVAEIEQAVDDVAVLVKRRNRFLDHMIARFAERFHDFAYTMYSAFGSSPAGMVAYKCQFLQHYPAISSERGLAYNDHLAQPEAVWNSTNVSGLEQRLAYLLGITNFTRRNLSEISYDIYAEVDSTPDDEFRFRVRHRVSNKILLSSSTKYLTPELAREEMQRAIQFAQFNSGYERKTTSDGKHYFNIIDDSGEVIARRIEYFVSENLMDDAIDQLMRYLREHYSEEGMYLIENILLRPVEEGDVFLPICPNPACDECADADPYTYRIHVILPAYAGRFSNMAFRRFAEGVIREETPAHILPKICWISIEDMAALESAYREWLAATPGQRSEKHKAFVDILYAVKSVYPAQRLHECDAEDEKPKFILGQSSIGSG